MALPLANRMLFLISTSTQKSLLRMLTMSVLIKSDREDFSFCTTLERLASAVASPPEPDLSEVMVEARDLSVFGLKSRAIVIVARGTRWITEVGKGRKSGATLARMVLDWPTAWELTLGLPTMPANCKGFTAWALEVRKAVCIESDSTRYLPSLTEETAYITTKNAKSKVIKSA